MRIKVKCNGQYGKINGKEKKPNIQIKYLIYKL